MIVINNNYLSESERLDIYDWVINSEYLDDFSLTETGSLDTKRRAFSVTYKSEEVPDILRHYVLPDYNIYNFIGIVTEISGDIPEHEDDDLVTHMRSIKCPEIFVKYPGTTVVYYVDICEDMDGGDLLHAGESYHPETNMLVTFPSNEPHSVTEVKSLTRPRVVLVCEKYKLLGPAIKLLNTPLWRAG